MEYTAVRAWRVLFPSDCPLGIKIGEDKAGATAVTGFHKLPMRIRHGDGNGAYSGDYWHLWIDAQRSRSRGLRIARLCGAHKGVRRSWHRPERLRELHPRLLELRDEVLEHHARRVTAVAGP